VPFYVATPSSSIDWRIRDGLRDIPIEERAAEEVSEIEGTCGGEVTRVRLLPPASPALNPAFDVTPARLVTGLVTERGVCAASEDALLELFPEQRS
jgi:methylthioribose-1-phosphate isomerase